MRKSNDFYETASWQVDALTNNLPELSGHIFCPCVGDGSLLTRLVHNRPDLGPYTTNDLDVTKTADFHLHAGSQVLWDRLKSECSEIDWVVENPPFNEEIDILKLAWKHCIKGVAFMSRISFTEPTRERGQWLKDHPYQKRITLERYSFTQTGRTDSTTTDWLIWSKIPLSGPFGVSSYGYRP